MTVIFQDQHDEPRRLGTPVPQIDSSQVGNVTYDILGERVIVGIGHTRHQIMHQANIWDDDGLCTLLARVSEISGPGELAQADAKTRFWAYVAYQRGYLHRRTKPTSAEEPVTSDTGSPTPKPARDIFGRPDHPLECHPGGISITARDGKVWLATVRSQHVVEATDEAGVREIDRFLRGLYPDSLVTFWRAVATARLMGSRQAPVFASDAPLPFGIPEKGFGARRGLYGEYELYLDGKKLDAVTEVTVSFVPGQPPYVVISRALVDGVVELCVPDAASNVLDGQLMDLEPESDVVLYLDDEKLDAADSLPPAATVPVAEVVYHAVPGFRHGDGQTVAKPFRWLLTPEEYEAFRRVNSHDVGSFLTDFWGVSQENLLRMQAFRGKPPYQSQSGPEKK